MKVYRSYMEAFRAVLQNEKFTVAHLHELQANHNIDNQGCYKLFFSINGKRRFHINDQIYMCEPGSLFLLIPQDWHYFTDFDESADHERYAVFIHPQFLKECSTEHTDLSKCFQQIEKRKSGQVTLAQSEQNYLRYLFQKSSGRLAFGEDIADICFFLELMLAVNAIVIQRENGSPSELSQVRKLPELVIKVQAYIKEHIAEDLNISVLAKQFYLSPAYLNRIYKNATGLTVHKYVCAQRITLAKQLLAEGHSVTSVCEETGFHDYSNFIKVFTNAVGCTPKKYAKMF